VAAVARVERAQHPVAVEIGRWIEQGRGRQIRKVPSTEARDDPAQLRRLVMEEWIARRIDSPHVLKAQPQARRRSHLYTAMEYVEASVEGTLRATVAPVSESSAR
jgi:hypothetical protein